MITSFVTRLFIISIFAIATTNGAAQQPPKTNRTGNAVSIVRNDSTSPVTVEYRSNNQWQQLKLDAGQDTTVPGDRIRVATTRADNAVVTVDLPLQAGKKYRLVWNAQSTMWDFSPVL